VKQAHTEFRLQRGDGMAQRRVRHAEVGRSCAEAAVVRHRQHGIELTGPDDPIVQIPAPLHAELCILSGQS
jgi:hypothetical protein